MKRREHGEVYFVDDGESVKIGFSRWPTSRLDDLQSAHPRRLTIIATFPGTMNDERALHQHLSRFNVRGEWFKRGEHIEAVIAKLESCRRELRPGSLTVASILERPLWTAHWQLTKWIRANQRRLSGTPKFREAMVLHRRAADMLAAN